MLLYNASQPLDRYNMPDTLKGQHISKLQTGSCLHSDMGRLLASLVDSSLDWHDPLCGFTHPGETVEKFGKKTFGESLNDYYKNGWDNFLRELGKHGMGKKDLVPCVNLFSKVHADEEGKLIYTEDHGSIDDYVMLRMELKTIVILSNTPHPLHPPGDYPGGKITLEVFDEIPTDPESDVCIQSRPENLRAWENTRDLLAMEGSK